jgi:L-cysteine S-thiosulfotransferase
LLGLLVFSLAFGGSASDDVEAVLKRDFKARGQATMDRVVQDGLQRVCTESNDRPPAALAKQLEADQMKTIAFPEGSLIGDWKRGERIAQGGRGLTWSDRAGAPGEGSCYNCHQVGPQESSFGTLGPSLLGFGKARGSGAETQRYVYGKIYNAKAYNLCSQMPRLGHSGTLTPEQIKDLVALLLDPASPVNR